MSRRALFRPRAIDLQRPLLIIRSDADLKSDVEVVSAQRALPEYGTGVEEGELGERHLQEALLASMNLRIKRAETKSTAQEEDAESASCDHVDGRRTVIIPVPVIREIPCYTEALLEQVRNRFQLSDTYVDARADDRALLEREIDYEADDGDKRFAQNELCIDLDTFERAMDALEKEQGTARTLMSPNSAKSQLMKDATLGLNEQHIDALYMHWRRKREQRGGQPILRYLRDPPDVNNPDPSVAFRPRNDEEQKRRARSNTFDNYKRLRRIRQDMERVRTIMEQVMKRERIKLDLVLFTISSQLATLQLRYPHLELIQKAAKILPLKTPIGADLYRHLTNIAELARKGVLKWNIAHRRRSEEKASSDHSGTSVTKIRATSAAKPPDSGSAGSVVAAPKRDLYGFDEKGFQAFRRLRYFSGGFFRDGINPFDWRVHGIPLWADPSLSHSVQERSQLGNITAERSIPQGARPAPSMELEASRLRKPLRCASTLIARLTTPMAYAILDAAASKNHPEEQTSLVVSASRMSSDGMKRIADTPAVGPKRLMCFPDSTPLCDQSTMVRTSFRPTLVRARIGCDDAIYLDRITIRRETDKLSASELPAKLDAWSSREWQRPWPKRLKHSAPPTAESVHKTASLDEKQ